MEIAKIVSMRARPGWAAGLGHALADLVAASRAEEGCTDCILHRSPEETDLFMVYERWKGEDAFAAHMETPHVAAFLAQIDQLLAEPPDIRPFDHLG